MELFLLTSVRKSHFILLLLFMCIATPPPARAAAMDLPDEGLKLLAAATAETCTVCIDQLRQKAFKQLNSQLSPGKTLNSSAACTFIKPAGAARTELSLSCHPSAGLLESLPEGAFAPRLVLRFHTKENHLVGIAATDFTNKDLAELYTAAGPNTSFNGELRLIAFSYGTGPAYNFYAQTNTLEIHVVITALQPVQP